MRTLRVTRYGCDFCRHSRSSAEAIKQHQLHCFKNPNRIPYDGEITKPWICFGDESEPPEDAWEHPGDGKIWTGTEWIAVPGYTYNKWPDFSGVTLDKMPPLTRLATLFPDPALATLDQF